MHLLYDVEQEDGQINQQVDPNDIRGLTADPATLQEGAPVKANKNGQGRWVRGINN